MAVSAVSFAVRKVTEQIHKSLEGQKRYSNAADNIKLYVDFLIENNLPPLIDVWYLAKFTDIPVNILCAAIAKPDIFYREFKIPKKRGGFRQVNAPIPSLLSTQKWIVKNLLNNIEVHSSATAYKKGLGILSNVKPHAGKENLLKIDLKDFFHTITINRVISVFQNLGYLPKISYELASLCCLHGCLPQGAATSPILSNIIAKRLDKRLSGLSRKFELQYTRYSDDITFSGENIPPSLISLIKHIIYEEGFTVNDSKTRLYTSPGKRIVTGVSVSNKRLRLPRNTKRKLRQDFYEVMKTLQERDCLEGLEYDVFFLESLKGRMAFWSYIEPEAEYPRKAIEKLGAVNLFEG